MFWEWLSIWNIEKEMWIREKKRIGQQDWKSKEASGGSLVVEFCITKRIWILYKQNDICITWISRLFFYNNIITWRRYFVFYVTNTPVYLYETTHFLNTMFNYRIQFVELYLFRVVVKKNRNLNELIIPIRKDYS